MQMKFIKLLFLSFIISGCATTYQEHKVDPAGFLGDYSRLKKGKDDEALLVYRAPDLNTICKTYNKVLIEPITIWVKDKSSIADVPKKDLDHLKTYLYQSAKKALEGDYQLVNQAGTGVIRIRGAITEAEGSIVVLDSLTSIHPGTVLMSDLKQLAFGSGAFVASTAIEFSIEDSITRKPLIMGVDKRDGGKNWVKKFDSWGKVEAAYDYWTNDLKTKLSECRAGKLAI